MAREFRILHHRYGHGGGHWDLVEDATPYRSAAAGAPHGESSLCAALQHLGEQGWAPLLSLEHTQAQAGETFLLLGRD
jgi:hypothetical protein